MNLLDLFENPLPQGVKLSDVPPTMRQKLTMRDVEKERPAGAFRFRVMFPDGTHSDFMDFERAKQAADLEKGRVVRLSEVKKKLSEAESKLATGIANYMKVRKTGDTDEPIYLELDTGTKRIEDKFTKRAIVKQYERALEKDAIERRRAPSQPQDLFGKPEAPETSAKGRWQQDFLLSMTSEQGLAKILAPYIEAIKRNIKFAQSGGSIPGERGYQEKLPQDFKFESITTEADIKDKSARTQTMITRLRQAHPQAKSDAEALAYAFVDAQRKDQQAISKLEKELDDVEQDAINDLRKQISGIKQRREKTQQRGKDRSAADDRQDALLKRLDQVNAMQDQAIQDLEKEIDGVEKTTASLSVPRGSVATPAPVPTQSIKPAKSVPQVRSVPPAAAKARQQRQIRKAEKDLGKELGPLSMGDGQAANEPSQADIFQQAAESLQQGEYHNAEVTFDDGSKETVKITTDEGFRDMIIQHFAKQNKKVVDIDVDYSVRSVNEGEKKPKPTNPQLWGRAKSAAKSKFDVYPSAYANAWAAKWYKQHGGGWR